MKPVPVPLCCDRCRKTYAASQDFVDLTLLQGGGGGAGGGGTDGGFPAALFSTLSSFGLPLPPLPSTDASLNQPGTRIFQSPLVAYAYERGWRQGFSVAGFPGVEREFQIALGYTEAAHAVGEGILIDMSCGSGLFSRRFAASGGFARIVAADFSESMLRQTRELCEKDAVAAAALSAGTLSLVRADVARMPFATASVAAVHAGAALHCWPNSTAAFAEVSRVLRPGGVFVGSTFMVGVGGAALLAHS